MEFQSTLPRRERRHKRTKLSAVFVINAVIDFPEQKTLLQKQRREEGKTSVQGLETVRTHRIIRVHYRFAPL